MKPSQIGLADRQSPPPLNSHHLCWEHPPYPLFTPKLAAPCTVPSPNPRHVSGRVVSITPYLPPARRSLWGSLSGCGGPPPPSRRAKGQSDCFDSIHTACPRAQRDLRTWQESECQEPPERTVRTPRNPGCHRGYKTPLHSTWSRYRRGLTWEALRIILFTAYFIRGMGPTPHPTPRSMGSTAHLTSSMGSIEHLYQGHWWGAQPTLPGTQGLQLTSARARGPRAHLIRGTGT